MFRTKVKSSVDSDLVEGETTVKTTSNGKQHGSHSVQEQAAVSRYFARKTWPVRIIAALLLVIAAPVILLLVLIVRCTSPGRGLYQQARMGRHGEEFMIYKIRTMYQDAESACGPVWCRPGDSRITPVGKVLRLLHLDELPQLINVVRGEMDLIGPRPERPVFIAKLAREIPGYHDRLQVLPGVTGLAQINLPPDETLDCVRKKLVLDCQYISEASLFLDVRILLCTFLRMLGIRHGLAPHWLGLMRHVRPEFGRGREPLHVSLTRPHPEYRPAAAGQFNGRGECLTLVAAGHDAENSIGNADLQASAELGPLSVQRPR